MDVFKKQCPKCGKKFRELDNYCTQCGVGLEMLPNMCSEMKTVLCEHRVYADGDIYCACRKNGGANEKGL